MTSCRFPDAMGDVAKEGDFDDHAAALAWARDDDHERTSSGSSTSDRSAKALGGRMG